MIETIVAIVVLIVLWNLRQAFYNVSGVYKEKVDIATTDSKVDLQEDYKALHQRIVTTKKSNSGQWYSMKDIEDAMKSQSE